MPRRRLPAAAWAGLLLAPQLRQRFCPLGHSGTSHLSISLIPGISVASLCRLLPAAAGPGLRLASRSASVRATRGSVGVRAETQYLTTAEEAKSLIDQGYTVLDVRDPTQYVRSHVSGSVHVPFFIVNEDQDLRECQSLDFFLFFLHTRNEQCRD